MTQPNTVMTLPLEGGGEVRVVTGEEPIMEPHSTLMVDVAEGAEGGQHCLNSTELALATGAAISGHQDALAKELRAEIGDGLDETEAAARVMGVWQQVEAVYREQTLIETGANWKSLQTQLELKPPQESVEETSIVKTGEWRKPLVDDAVSTLSRAEQEGYEEANLTLKDVVAEHVAHAKKAEEDPLMLDPWDASIALSALSKAFADAVESKDIAGQVLNLAAVDWVMQHTVTSVTRINYPPHMGVSDMTGQSVLAAVQ